MPEYKKKAYIRIGLGVLALAVVYLLGTIGATGTIATVLGWILIVVGIVLIVQGCRIYVRRKG